QPIGAMIASHRIYDAITRGSGFFQHGHTYIGHATACAAALEVQKVIAEERLLANVLARGEQLRAALRERFAAHPHVGDVRGRGLFVGVELVADRATKAPLSPARKTHARVRTEAMQRGLMVYPMGGTIDGQRGDHILLAPPFIATAQDIDAIVERLGDAVEAATANALEVA
ncbi:aminotransferase class III-fold pyridoxal phosphate-dependent enzyme, partial [Ralstonia solanacearum]